MYKTTDKSQLSLLDFHQPLGFRMRLALGSLIIQNRFQYSDRELVEQLSENPYLQYFIGLPGYQA